jgi:mono/diheme cytochrome c family protein
MPAFAGTLTDEEIWAVLAYIKSAWPEEIRKAQAAVNRARQRQ